MVEEKKSTIKFYAFISILTVLLVIAILMMIKYQVEGEKNLPFTISKITVISTAEGIRKENEENKRIFDLVENNDIYIEIEKKPEYEGKDYIQKIILDEFKIEKEPQIGSIRKYMPNSLEGRMFIHQDESLVDMKLEYKGGVKDSLKDLQIGNQGGIVAIRYENGDLGEYISNEEEEIVHNGKMLTKQNITMEELNFKISFALTMKLAEASYQTRIVLDLPNGDILTEGTVTKEIEEEFVFKRIRLEE